MRTRSRQLLILGMILPIAGAVSAADWPTYQGSPAHAGYVPTTLDPARFTLRWQVPVGDGDALNPVAAAQDLVFVTTTSWFDNGGLYVVRLGDGGEEWRKTYGDVASVNDPAYADGKVYVQIGDHTPGTFLNAYEAATGDVVFEAPFSAQWEHYLAPTVVDGVAYINCGYYGGMCAFDGTSGRQLWFADQPQYDEWTPAVDAQFAYSYVGGTVYAFNRRTGALEFTILDPNFGWSGWSPGQAPVLDSFGGLYALNDQRLIRFDLVLHEVAWEFRSSFTGQPTLARNVLYAIDGTALTAWNPSTPSFAWRWSPPAGDPLRGTIIVTDSHAIVSGDKATYAIDLATHLEVWSFPKGGPIALSARTLLIAAPDGMLTAIDLAGDPCPAAEIPAAIRNLRMARESTNDAGLHWDSDPLAFGGYHAYRFVDPAEAPTANLSGLRIVTTARDPAATYGVDAGAILRLPALQFYQVAGVCDTGDEGPL